MKPCGKCKIISSDFSRRNRSKDGLQANCKKCMLEYAQKWAKANKDRVSAASKRWKRKNPYKVKQIQEKRVRNKASRQKYEKTRYHKDENFRLRKLLRGRVRAALAGKYRCDSAISGLGCSVESLKLHLETQFKEGMNWNNQGLWHIDHIKPLVQFDLTDVAQFLEACHYTNLQPLWGKENLAKRWTDAKLK